MEEQELEVAEMATIPGEPVCFNQPVVKDEYGGCAEDTKFLLFGYFRGPFQRTTAMFSSLSK